MRGEMYVKESKCKGCEMIWSRRRQIEINGDDTEEATVDRITTQTERALSSNLEVSI